MENDFNYENAIAELNSIVSKLQNGNVSLDDSLALYMRGIELSKKCEDKINEVEKKISMVTANGEVPFEYKPGEIK